MAIKLGKRSVSFAKRDCKFFKVDRSEGVAYGWLIVSTIKGEPYFDLQGDHIPLVAAKRAMADFMKHSRASDEQHDEKTIGDVVYAFPVEKGVTSSIFGISGDVDQEGIVIGFKPHDPAKLDAIDKGERNGFSIGGGLASAHYVTKRGNVSGLALAGRELAERDREFAKERSAIVKSGAATEPKQLRIFDEFTIDFASLVDWPAQEGALISVVKSAPVAPGTLMWIRKDASLTSVSDGHQHIIDVDCQLDDDGDRGWTSTAATPDEDYGHSHDYVVDADGNITIAATRGHTHTTDAKAPKKTATPELSPGTQIMDPIAARSPHAARNSLQNGSAGVAPIVKEHLMTPEQIAELKKSLADALALAELNDAEKAYAKSLTSRDHAAFLAMSSADRAAVLAKHATADEVVYKCDDGTEIRKSDGKLVEMQARKLDAQSQKLAKQDEAIEKAAFEKRAEKELGHLPGSVSGRAALLKAAEKIANEDDRKVALAALVAADKQLAKSFKRIGKSARPGDEDNGDGDPSEALEKMAKAHAKENKISYAKAYEAVLETDAGQDLYTQMEVDAGRAGNIGAGDFDDDDGSNDDLDGEGGDDGDDDAAE